jgi:hypothetical protein
MSSIRIDCVPLRDSKGYQSEEWRFQLTCLVFTDKNVGGSQMCENKREWEQKTWILRCTSFLIAYSDVMMMSCCRAVSDCTELVHPVETICRHFGFRSGSRPGSRATTSGHSRQVCVGAESIYSSLGRREFVPQDSLKSKAVPVTGRGGL